MCRCWTVVVEKKNFRRVLRKSNVQQYGKISHMKKADENAQCVSEKQLFSFFPLP